MENEQLNLAQLFHSDVLTTQRLWISERTQPLGSLTKTRHRWQTKRTPSYGEWQMDDPVYTFHRDCYCVSQRGRGSRTPISQHGTHLWILYPLSKTEKARKHWRTCVDCTGAELGCGQCCKCNLWAEYRISYFLWGNLHAYRWRFLSPKTMVLFKTSRGFVVSGARGKRFWRCRIACVAGRHSPPGLGRFLQTRVENTYCSYSVRSSALSARNGTSLVFHRSNLSCTSSAVQLKSHLE